LLFTEACLDPFKIASVTNNPHFYRILTLFFRYYEKSRTDG